MKIANTNYYQYAMDVIDGKRIAGRSIRLACERFIRDLEDPRFIFKPNKAQKIIDFAHLFTHYSGKTAGTRMKLEPWQEFYFANLFGFYLADKPDVRRYNDSYLQVARKAGKTFISAILCLYCIIMDGETDPQVLLYAYNREQASTCLKMCKALIQQIDPKHKYVKIFKNELRLARTDGFLKVMSSDGSSSDSYSPSFVILDETHTYKDDEIYEAVMSGSGARKHPLCCQITTAGFLLDGYAKSIRDIGIEVLEGIKEDPHTFYLIFEMDEDDDIEDPTNWEKANPNMNVTVDIEYLKKRLEKGKIQPSAKNRISTKNLNVWCSRPATWIPMEDVNKVCKAMTWEEFENKTIYIGVDLTTTRDMGAVTFMYIDDNGLFKFKSQCFLPETALDGQGDAPYYKSFIKEGSLIITDGNVVDYDAISQFIKDKSLNSYVSCIAYDKYNATQWAMGMINDGFYLVDYSHVTVSKRYSCFFQSVKGFPS